MDTPLIERPTDELGPLSRTSSSGRPRSRRAERGPQATTDHRAVTLGPFLAARALAQTAPSRNGSIPRSNCVARAPSVMGILGSAYTVYFDSAAAFETSTAWT